MINIYINGNPVEAELESEQTVGDVLKSFELTCEKNDAAVIGILVDGEQITADKFDKAAGKPLTDKTKFEFSVITKADIKTSFEELSKCFDELSSKMENVHTEFQNGKASYVTESIKELADKIDQFCHVATLASLFPETYKNTNIDGKSFNDFFADFSPVLRDFEAALQNNDTVLIGDLSEYEICPRLKAISQALKDM